MRILIVDDSQAMTAIVRRTVMASGIPLLEIETAKSGDEALECIRRFQPNLMLTDWHMPGMSGLELVQNMRQLGFTDTHVGFITTEAKPEMLAESKRNGVDFFLNKPFNDEVLWEHLRKLSTDLASKLQPGKPVPLDTLTAITKKAIIAVPFRLVEQPMVSQDLSDLNLLGLYYYEGTKSPMAISVMDINSVIIVGAGAMSMQPADAKKVMLTGKPTAEIQAQAGKYLGMVAGHMNAPADAPISMLKQSMVNRDFPKLQEVLKKNRGSSFFRIDIPGYGSGRLGFILV